MDLLYLFQTQHKGHIYSLPGCWFIGTQNEQNVEDCEGFGGTAYLSSATKRIREADVWFCGFTEHGPPPERNGLKATREMVRNLQYSMPGSHGVHAAMNPLLGDRLGLGYRCS